MSRANPRARRRAGAPGWPGWCWPLALALGVGGCEVRQLDVAYLQIDEIAVENPFEAGARDDVRITDVRVVDGAGTQGFYPVPGVIPVLDATPRVLRLEPVVRLAGLSESRLVYPLYEAVERPFDLAPGQTLGLSPVVGYIDGVRFPLREGFDGRVERFVVELDDFDETRFEVVADPVDPARAVGRARLTEDADLLEVTTEVVAIDEPFTQAWLEVVYRGDVDLNIAVLGTNLQTPAERGALFLQGVRARDDYRRFYFDLQLGATREILTAGFRIDLLAAYDPALGGAAQELFVDEVRVVAR